MLRHVLQATLVLDEAPGEHERAQRFVAVEVRKVLAGAKQDPVLSSPPRGPVRGIGAPEERVDSRKIGHLYRAAQAFKRSEDARQLGIGALEVRVDLVVVDLRGVTPAIRHLRRLEPA